MCQRARRKGTTGKRVRTKGTRRHDESGTQEYLAPHTHAIDGLREISRFNRPMPRQSMGKRLFSALPGSDDSP